MVDEKAINEAIAKRLKVVRLESGFTSEFAAEALGVSADMLESFERGEQVPNAVQLTEFCKSFGVSFDYMCGVVDTPHEDIDCHKLNYMGNMILSSIYRTLIKNKTFTKKKE